MEYDVVDKKKYPSYSKFGFGTYLFRIGINPVASVAVLAWFYLFPFLIIRFFGMPPIGVSLISLGLVLMTLVLLISPLILYSQKIVIENDRFIVKVKNKIIREFSLHEINQIKKVKRFNGAYELRFNGGSRVMFLFTDEVPKELEQFVAFK